MTPEDTIAAVASPAGTGAVALLRVSGGDALAVAQRVFRGGSLTPRRAVYGAACDASGQEIDSVLATYFKGPASFTGEDTVEITCHGGMLVTRRVLEALLRSGARAAEPGEFTQRAWLNGKLDLTQAEAVMDVISAQTDMALRAAQRQLDGAIGQRVTALRDELLDVLAHVEAYIDFPEEDISPDTGAVLRGNITQVAEGIQRLLATADQGRILREGARTVLAGAPNAGKSSLLNRLLGCERAIVSEIPGTTRDTIEEVINVQGVPLRLVDTAGLRESGDVIEREGVARTRRMVENADLLLEVVDASQPPAERVAVPPESGVKVLLVLNKTDLGLHEAWRGAGGVEVSCLTGQGIDTLTAAMVGMLDGGAGFTGMEAAVNARHKACLERAAAALSAGLQQLDAGAAPEFVSMDLRDALTALGEVAGLVSTEDLLGVIFSRFCIGK
ncbi:MAG TPA: tRNA uridine-5-carboxymethylaminomethyl(34) synthesis GTPase MnmE [Verrucomicrobiales bacterium]|nr:tRNA uridine-5-carboxymethylaminomethyl(34) synthesis GTPase MnmE [Verrucomicrobiales bacterium]